MRRDRLPVEGDNERVMIPELEPEDACRRSVDQTQPNPLAGVNSEAIGDAAIDRNCVTDAPRHADFHRIVESACDRAIRLEGQKCRGDTMNLSTRLQPQNNIFNLHYDCSSPALGSWCLQIHSIVLAV